MPETAARLAALEQAHQAQAEALARIEVQLAALAARPAPSGKVIPWWVFVGVLMIWGALFHLLFR